jgi:hypothetical protein
VGALLCGLVGEALGLEAVFLIFAGLSLLLLLARAQLNERALASAESEAAPAAATA